MALWIKHSLEQQFRKSNTITFIVGKTGALAIVELSLRAGRQAVRQMKVSNLKFCIFYF